MFINYETYINMFSAVAMFLALFLSTDRKVPTAMDLAMAGLTFLAFSMLVLNTMVNIIAKQREKRTSKRELKEKKAGLQIAIDKTYNEVVELYKQHDIELEETPQLESYLKRSYGSRAGGVACRRKRLQKELSLLNE